VLWLMCSLYILSLRMNYWNTLLMTRWWNLDKLKDRGYSW
jgi:hypothetical protein